MPTIQKILLYVAIIVIVSFIIYKVSKIKRI